MADHQCCVRADTIAKMEHAGVTPQKQARRALAAFTKFKLHVCTPTPLARLAALQRRKYQISINTQKYTPSVCISFWKKESTRVYSVAVFLQHGEQQLSKSFSFAVVPAP
jgi:hypothetical protein